MTIVKAIQREAMIRPSNRCKKETMMTDQRHSKIRQIKCIEEWHLKATTSYIHRMVSSSGIGARASMSQNLPTNPVYPIFSIRKNTLLRAKTKASNVDSQRLA